MGRAAKLAIVICVLLTGVLVISFYAAFEQLILHPAALLGSILLAGIMSLIILLVALVPSERYVGWVRTITGPNGRWLFLLLIILWGAGMAFLASLGLGPQQMGAPAFLGLFAGIFLFMGFIWSVVGQ